MDPYKHLFDVLFQDKFAPKMRALKDLKVIAARDPEALLPYFPQLFRELETGPEKLKWGIMMLLSLCAPLDKEAIFSQLGLFAAIADGPSVIARDAYVRMLAMLAQEQSYAETATALLLDEVLKSPVNQLPSYTETATKHIAVEQYAQLADIIRIRLPDVAEYPSKEKRLQHCLKLLRKG